MPTLEGITMDIATRCALINKRSDIAREAADLQARLSALAAEDMELAHELATALPEELPSALEGFTIAEMLHEPTCEGCIAEAESAAITAKVTGSIGATHATDKRTAEGELIILHSARVTREIKVPESTWNDLFAGGGKSGLFEL